MKRIATFFLFIVLFLLWGISTLAWSTPTRSVSLILANRTAHVSPNGPAGPSSLQQLQNVEQIAVGAYHSCAVIGEPPASGGVKCWGLNDYGQLGDNTTDMRNLPVDVIGLSSGIRAVVAGANHTCALNSAGGVKCWGMNEFGQLGDGTLQNRRVPSEVQGLNSGVLALAAADHHTCALLAAAVKCWGANDYGQLGDGTSTQHNTPVDVSGLTTGVTRIAAGGNHTCAVTNSSGLKCWGNNDYGQLGDGSTVLSRTMPVDVMGLSSDVTIVSLGGSHTCAVVNGGARCWGLNSDGQLGDDSGSDTNASVPVFNLSSGVSAITTGEKHSCALLNSGGVKCWGRNANGEVGDTFNNYYITMPVDVADLGSDVAEVAAGSRHTCARMNSGSVKCWGLNEGGQLGDGVSYLHATPVTVTGLSSGVTDIAVGKLHSCALLNGGAKCWGDNGYRQLGMDNPIFSTSPIPVDVATSGVTLTALAAGYDHTCALTTSGGISGGTGGGLKCWGGNYWGQLGGGNNKYTDQIIDVLGLTTGVMTFSTRIDHTCALVAGNAKCWGHNEYGQLGSGDTTDHYTPVDVVGLQDGELSALAGGGFHTCALTKSGGVMCWGFNQQGELGTGAVTVSETTPVSVTGLVSEVVAISAGMYHSCALLASGGVKCWGVNDYGQLGDNSNQDRYAPVDVTNLTSGVKAISAGFYYTCALLNNGEIKCWGQNESGQLGDGTFANRKAPVTPSGLDGAATRIAAGSAHTCAAMSLGGIKCWGNGAYGQLGNGELAWRHTPADVLVAGDFLTPTVTPTPLTPTATPTGPTPIPTATNPPSGVGDTFENDDDCTNARAIDTSGTEQTHTFHVQGDADWLIFDATSGIDYRIEVTIPDGSAADVDLEVYAACTGGLTDQWKAAFNPGVRLNFTATASGKIHLRIANHDAAQFGSTMRYTVNVRQLSNAPTNRALIIVAGRLRGSDRLQKNIHNLSNQAYKIFQQNGYDNETIKYLATDSSLAGWDEAATKASVQAAITSWAVSKTGANGVITLYMVDHGHPNLFYVDEVSQQRITPSELNDWLTQLENAVPGVTINVIIEACQSGSFIQKPNSISKAGRLVITSTDAENDAKASTNGAYFSDQLLTQLAQGRDLANSFSEARKAAKQIFSLQNAWLDADGDGVANQTTDNNVAAQRGFAFADTFGEGWAPYIFSAQPPSTITNFSGIITADVRDNLGVRQVWAVVYPPDYTPTAPGQELQPETLENFILSPTGNADQYAGKFSGFTQVGTYRLMIYADDADGLAAAPVEITVNTGSKVFLPLVVR